MIIDLDITWQVGILILLGILFLIYLCFGGGDHQYIGLAPLEIGFDASRHVEHSKCGKRNNIEDEDENSNEEDILIDNSPIIPDLSKIPVPPKKEIKIKNRFSSSNSSNSFNSKSFSFSHDASEISEGHIDLMELSDSYVENLENIEDVKTPVTPRTAALGGYVCRTNGFISKGEKLCKQAIEEITGKPFFCVRPDFLKNPESGKNLEIDLFNAELMLALEYNGQQHNVYPNSFHKTEEEFINQVRRDQFKVDMCDINGVYLITVPYNVPLNLETIKKYITYYMPENAHLRT